MSNFSIFSNVSSKVAVFVACMVLSTGIVHARSIGGIRVSQRNAEFAKDLAIPEMHVHLLKKKYPPARFREFRRVQKKLLRSLTPKERALLEKTYQVISEHAKDQLAAEFSDDLSSRIKKHGAPSTWESKVWEDYVWDLSQLVYQLNDTADSFYEGELEELISEVAKRMMLPQDELAARAARQDDEIDSLTSQLSDKANTILEYCLRAGSEMCDICTNE